jgi:DNA-binding response OmpR family regulator
LVIDTDPDTGAAIRQLGNGELYSVEEVERGDKGLSMAPEYKPSAIVLNADIHAGFTYCRRIRRHQDLSDIPLVLVSAKASEEQFQEHKRLPTHADLYLHKPLDTAALEELLAALFQSEEGTRGNKDGEPPKPAEPVVAKADSNAPKTADVDSQNARDEQSMHTLAHELQELREAYAKLLEEHDRGPRTSDQANDKDTEEMNKQVSELLKQCAVLEGEQSNYQERMTALEGEIESLKARAAEDDSLRDGFEGEIAQYEKQLQEQEAAMEELRSQLKEQASSGINFEESIQAVDEALQAACRVVAELRNPDAADEEKDEDDSSDLAVEF